MGVEGEGKWGACPIIELNHEQTQGDGEKGSEKGAGHLDGAYSKVLQAMAIEPTAVIRESEVGKGALWSALCLMKGRIA